MTKSEKKSVRRRAAKVRRPSIEEMFRDGRCIDEALRQGTREALLRHKQAGNPIATWKSGRVVWIQPKDIPV